jgi:hypothetical protein
MIDRKKALDILNREKDYEDKLVITILNFCRECSPEILDMTSSEKEEAHRVLNQIADESQEHSRMFEGLIEFILENEQDNY